MKRERWLVNKESKYKITETTYLVGKAFGSHGQLESIPPHWSCPGREFVRR